MPFVYFLLATRSATETVFPGSHADSESTPADPDVCLEKSGLAVQTLSGCGSHRHDTWRLQLWPSNVRCMINSTVTKAEEKISFYEFFKNQNPNVYSNRTSEIKKVGPNVGSFFRAMKTPISNYTQRYFSKSLSHLTTRMKIPGSTEYPGITLRFPRAWWYIQMAPCHHQTSTTSFPKSFSLWRPKPVDQSLRFWRVILTERFC